VSNFTHRANVYYGFLGSIISTLLISWPVIFGSKLFGDLLDARFTIVINDHWYQVLSGQRSFTNVGFYSPTSNQLGYSDGFFATGLLAVPMRFLGASALESWVISNFILMVICFYFATILVSKILSNNLYGFLVTVLFATSYPFIAQMGHLQTVGYLLIFPILFFAHQIYVENKNQFKSFFVLIIMMQILALTSWYAFVFVVSLAFLCLGVYTLFIGHRSVVDSAKQVFASTQSDLKSKPVTKKIVSLLSLFVLPILWLRIYAVGFNQVSYKDYMEFVFYAPRWGDLFNSVNQSWGLQAKFNEKTGQSVSQTFERALGITPILFILITFMTLQIISSRNRIESNAKKIVLTLLVTAILPSLIVVTDEAGHSFWRFIWELVTPLRSIRVPFRIAVYTTWILVFLVFYVMVKSGMKRWAFFLVFSILIIDTWRPIPASWSSEELISKNGQAVEKTLIRENCDNFFLNPSESNQAKWLTQVEAMVIANSLGLETVNGYSGNWPNNWPIERYWGRATVTDIGNWSKQNQENKEKLCFINEDEPNSILLP
jgi:hypothetical protein